MSPSDQPTPPPEPKPLQTFGLHVVFISLLLWMLPSLDAAFGFGFTTAGNATFGRLGSDLRVEYRWVPPSERVLEGEIEMVGWVAGYQNAAWESRYEIRERAYLPTTILIALILATPASRPRHVAGIVLGASFLNFFYLAQTGLLAACLFASVEPDLIALGGALAAMLPVVKAFFGSPLVRYAAVFAIWAVAATPARGLDLGAASERLASLLGRRGTQ